MAHKYATFNAAFSDMAGRYAQAKQYKDWALLNAQSAYSGVSDPVDKLHFGYATYAIECLCTVFNHVADLTELAYDQSHLYESLYWAGQGGGGGTDMDSILTAMITATPAQLEKFIGIVDAYRVALWNAPFNADFYGALARGFQQWP